jgi:hypothetical protein
MSALLEVLAGRGIEDIDAFLKVPSWNDLPDPFSIPSMEKAADRVLCTVRRRERITIFGDYVERVMMSSCIVHAASMLPTGSLLVRIISNRYPNEEMTFRNSSCAQASRTIFCLAAITVFVCWLRSNGDAASRMRPNTVTRIVKYRKSLCRQVQRA